MRAFWACIVVLAVAGAASADTHYVKKIDGTIYHATSGWPTASDSSATDLEAVIELAGVATGDTVSICGGTAGVTFTGTEIDADSNLDIDKSIIVTGAPAADADCGGQVTLDVGGATVNGVRPSVHCAGAAGSCAIKRLKIYNVSAAATNYGLYSTANTWDFEDLTIDTAYRGLYTSGTSCRLNRLKIYNTADAAIQFAGAATWNYGEIVNAGSAIWVSAAVSPTVNNVLVDGASSYTVLNSSTGEITLNNVILSSTGHGNSARYPLANGSSGTINFNNGILLPTVGDVTKISTGGTVNIDADTTYQTPQWVARRRPGILVFGVDDLTALSYFADTVAPKLEAYGWRGTFALSNPAGVSDWPAIQALVSAGHEVSAHGQTFANALTSRNGVQIQYTGAGTAAGAVTTSGEWAGTFATTTSIGGSENVTVTITATTTLSDVVDAFSGKPYTITVSNTDTNADNVLAKYLSTASYADIKTGATQIVLDHDRIAKGEMRDAAAAIEAGIPGYTVTSFVHPGNAGDSTTFGDLLAYGFLGARGDGTSGGYTLSSINVFNIRPKSLYTYFGNDADPQTTPGKVEKYIATLCEHLQFEGGVTVLYAHTTGELTASGWDAVLAEVSKCGVLVKTLGEAVSYIVTNGTTADQKTYTRTFGTSEANYQLLGTSPAINTGDTVTDLHTAATVATDLAGTSVLNRPDIGPYESSAIIYFDAAAAAGGNGSSAAPYNAFADYPFTGYMLRAGAILRLKGDLEALDMSGLTPTDTITVEPKPGHATSVTGFTPNTGSSTRLRARQAAGVVSAPPGW